MQDVSIFLGDDRVEVADAAFSAGRAIDPDRFIVNVWRDENNEGELHVSVHAPERVLLSVGDDDVVLESSNPYLVGPVTVHNTDDTPTVICVPGEPIHVFGHVRLIKGHHEAADYLAAEAEYLAECERFAAAAKAAHTHQFGSSGGAWQCACGATKPRIVGPGV